MSTIYVFSCLKIRKNIAVCSVKSSVAKANRPNGPSLPLTDAFASVHICWGSTGVDFNNSASSNSGNSNTISASAFKDMCKEVKMQAVKIPIHSRNQRQ